MTDFQWETEIDKVVLTGARYRFAIVVPSDWTEDRAIQFLMSRGWTNWSIEAPPPDVQRAIDDLGNVGITKPRGWWVHATWSGADSAVLPDRDGDLAYVTLDYYAPANAPDPGTPNEPGPKPQQPPALAAPSSWPMIAGLAVGALGVVAVMEMRKGHHMAHANPVDQTIRVRIGGKPTEIHILERADGRWSAAADKINRRSRKKTRVVEYGATKDEAVHKLLARINIVISRDVERYSKGNPVNPLSWRRIPDLRTAYDMAATASRERPGALVDVVADGDGYRIAVCQVPSARSLGTFKDGREYDYGSGKYRRARAV